MVRISSWNLVRVPKACMALGTHTKLQLEILIRSMISAIHKFWENILESSQNVTETPPWNFTRQWEYCMSVNYNILWLGSGISSHSKSNVANELFNPYSMLNFLKLLRLGQNPLNLKIKSLNGVLRLESLIHLKFIWMYFSGFNPSATEIGILREN